MEYLGSDMRARHTHCLFRTDVQTKVIAYFGLTKIDVLALHDI